MLKAGGMGFLDPRSWLVMFLQGDSKGKGNRNEMSTVPCKYFACKQAVGIEKKPTKFQTPALSVLSIIKPANKLARQSNSCRNGAASATAAQGCTKPEPTNALTTH